MRLFYAVKLPKHLARNLAEVRLQGQLKGQVRWVDPALYHLTLQFCGEVASEQLSRFLEAGEKNASGTGSIRAGMTSLGVFPNLKKARVLWVGVGLSPEDEKRLNSLAQALGNPRFHAHLTLARFPARPPLGLSQLLQCHRTKTWGDFVIDKFSLFQSELTPKGPRYEELETWPL